MMWLCWQDGKGILRPIWRQPTPQLSEICIQMRVTGAAGPAVPSRPVQCSASSPDGRPILTRSAPLHEYINAAANQLPRQHVHRCITPKRGLCVITHWYVSLIWFTYTWQLTRFKPASYHSSAVLSSPDFKGASGLRNLSGNSAVPYHASRSVPIYLDIHLQTRCKVWETSPRGKARPLVFRVHTSRSHFTANSGYKETPTTPPVTNSGLPHISQPAVSCNLHSASVFFYFSAHCSCLLRVTALLEKSAQFKTWVLNVTFGQSARALKLIQGLMGQAGWFMSNLKMSDTFNNIFQSVFT